MNAKEFIIVSSISRNDVKLAPASAYINMQLPRDYLSSNSVIPPFYIDSLSTFRRTGPVDSVIRRCVRYGCSNFFTFCVEIMFRFNLYITQVIMISLSWIAVELIVISYWVWVKLIVSIFCANIVPQDEEYKWIKLYWFY